MPKPQLYWVARNGAHALVIFKNSSRDSNMLPGLRTTTSLKKKNERKKEKHRRRKLWEVF